MLRKRSIVLALVFSVISTFNVAVWSQDSGESAPSGDLREEDLLIRHPEFIGACRQTNRRLDVFSIPDVQHASDRIAVLDPYSRVTLTGWGANGWVEINAPTQGYIIARHLSVCPGSRPQPPSVAATAAAGECRVAIRDLAIRDRPTRPSRPVSGIPRGARMTLTGETQYDATTQRTWLEVSTPAAGWVSGSVGTASNVRSCD
jgi:hypothetical protein